MAKGAVETEICIVGAGPAGLAAAAAASGHCPVTIVDENPHPGGQIWRADARHGVDPEVTEILDRVSTRGYSLIKQATVVAAPAPNTLLAETPDGPCTITYRQLILATGARERFLPFPGWTLPNVMGAGGLQALVKGGLDITGRRVLIAGSGPLLPAVAAFLRQRGALVVLIAEQAPLRRLLRFGLTVLGDPVKLRQAVSLRQQLSGIRYLTDTYPVAADGDDRVRLVILQRGARVWSVACDYLACGFHLVPNLELAMLLGCRIVEGRVEVDEWQRTSISGVFSAGESTGVGGLDLSLLEGRIAGLVAAGNEREARALVGRRDRARRFARQIDRAFELTEVLRDLPSDQTIVCRCEDVSLGQLRPHNSWRAGKLQTRCGMGSCQGRICGPAIEFLLGWRAESIRPPILPARVGTLPGTLSRIDN
ncbi:MAG: FAD-dependent oxidoreductase [Blastocatellia bacterium]